MIKRICLFAGYDEQNVIDDYIIYYINKLSLISDVHYMADCNLPLFELEKLNNITITASAFRHGKYDFGSWQEIIKKIGWDRISEYDELILANDSCFGPLFALEPYFVKMDNNNIDFWGMTKNYEFKKPHLQSYFLVFKKNVFSNNLFQNFFNDIKTQETYVDIIYSYELILTELLSNAGFKYHYFFEDKLNPTFFYRTALKHGVPFIKLKIFKNRDFPRENPLFWKNIIVKYTDYNPDILNNYLSRYKINLQIQTFYYFKNKIFRPFEILKRKILIIFLKKEMDELS